jgi:hypothetical protein
MFRITPLPVEASYLIVSWLCVVVVVVVVVLCGVVHKYLALPLSLIDMLIEHAQRIVLAIAQCNHTHGQAACTGCKLRGGKVACATTNRPKKCVI